MNKAEVKVYLEKFKAILELEKKNEDYEVSHSKADELVIEILIQLGYKELAEAYESISKWYA